MLFKTAIQKPLFIFFLFLFSNFLSAQCGPENLSGYTFLGEFENSQYFISDATAQWQTAQLNANSATSNAYLATINSQAENDFILSNISEIVFIGYNDSQTEGTFEWANGESVTFDNFTDTNSPNNDFGKMNFWNGGWGVDNEYVSRRYIIEVPCSLIGNGIILTSCPGVIFESIPHGGNYETFITWNEPTATTDCPGGVITVTNVSGIEPGIFTPADDESFVQYELTDECGNTAICGFGMEINPAFSEITCPNDITIEATSANGAIVNYAAPSYQSYCTPNQLSVDNGFPSGSIFPIGTTTVDLRQNFSGTHQFCQVDAVCSFNVTVTPQGGGGGCADNISGFTTLGQFGNSKYYLSDGIAQPAAAQTIAAGNGGYLASISNQAENDFIQQNISEMVYIGLNDVQTEGTLIWESGESLNYNNINPCGFCESNSNNLDYVIIAPWDGSWSFSSQWNSRKYIMEIPCTSSGGLDISYDCPSDFPLSSNSWAMTVTVTNNTNVEQPAQEIYLHQDQSNSQGPQPQFLVGQATVPTLAVGTSASVTLQNTLPNFPFYYPDVTYFGMSFIIRSYDNYHLSFDPTGFAQTVPVDFYCKKYTTDLEVEIQNPTPLFTADNQVIYDVAVTNNGSETAYNIRTKLLQTVTALQFPPFVFNVVVNGTDPINWYRNLDREIVWAIDELAPGATTSVEIIYQLDGLGEFDPLPDDLLIEVEVSSGHLIDTDISNNTNSFLFLNDNSNPCPQSIAGFTFIGSMDGSNFFYSDNPERPIDAQLIALQNGGHLAVPNTQAKNDFIQQGIDEFAYIGLNDAQTEGNPMWINGTVFGYENFDFCSFCNENSESLDYVIIAPWNGGWSYSSQWNARKFVMETPCSTSNNIQSPVILLSNLEEEKQVKLERIFPNPARNILHIGITGKEDKTTLLQIFSSQGRLVRTQTIDLRIGTQTVDIDISKLPAGMYSLYLKGSNGREKSKRFVKIQD